MIQGALILAGLSARARAALDDAAETALQLLLFERDADRVELEARLRSQILPAVDERIGALRQSYSAEPDVEPAELERLSDGWADFKRLVRTGLDPQDEGQEQAMTHQAVAIIDPITTQVAEVAAHEVEHARESQEEAEATHQATRWRVVGIAATAALVWLVISLLLIRNLVPRVRAYSRFAAGVADGQPGEQLTVRGSDELAELGHTLNEMVRRRAEQRRYEETQAEFADTMQLSETEPEAHQLLKHHLERSITSSNVTVLNRNNSADRLEAATPVAPECPLTGSLAGAKPRSCLAVRFGRGYRGGEGRSPLLVCGICGSLPDAVSCEPLLVSGEVIGSILVNHPNPPAEEAHQRIRESVTQAAPVLANLRNLALAEIRAATDALTGLPKQPGRPGHHQAHGGPGVAQRLAAVGGPARPGPLQAINDAYGHSRGDEVLAAVAAVLRSPLRESDFVGRYGGEEFLLLLPDTGRDQAVVVAEKVREAVASLGLPEIAQPVTASLGIAAIPDDAGDADPLIRAADRALYAAKANGRNRVELFISPPRSARTPA